MVAHKMASDCNELEKSILKNGVSAQKKYAAMTDGWWLWHAPESFFQVVVAQGVAKDTGNSVYIDISLRKIEKELGRGPGRPAASAGQRPDISVWAKASDSVRAVIEIKRTMVLASIQVDAKKLIKIMRHSPHPSAAYILAYSLANGANRGEKLNRRFHRWEKATGWKLKGLFVYDDPSDEDSAWGIVLLRAQ